MNKRDALADSLYGQAVGTNHGGPDGTPGTRDERRVERGEREDGRSGESPRILEFDERVEDGVR